METQEMNLEINQPMQENSEIKMGVVPDQETIDILTKSQNGTKEPRKSKAQRMLEGNTLSTAKRKGHERKNSFEFSYSMKEFSAQNGQLLYDKVRSRKIRIEAALEFVKHNIGKYSDFKISYSPKAWNAGIKSLDRYNQCQAVENFVNNYRKEANNG